MERLTYFKDGYWRVNFSGVQYQADFVDRLAAYEDTGLTPEEIKAPFTEDTMINLASKALGVEPSRIRELAEADKDGRVVVLPCNGYSDIDIVRNGISYKPDHWNIHLTAFAHGQNTTSGLKVGLLTLVRSGGRWRKWRPRRMAELKPCPFCGGEVEETGGSCNFGKKIMTLNVKCRKCGTSVALKTAWNTNAYSEAVEAWNRRVNDG